MMHNFTFELRDVVEIEASGETGQVVARSQHATSEDQYLLRYRNAAGIAVEQWWGESALIAA